MGNPRLPHEFMATMTPAKYLYLLEVVVRWGISIIFVVAAVPKLLHPQEFADTISAYGLLPDMLVAPFALVIPALELVLVYGLSRKKNWGWFGSGGLLLVFIMVLGYGIHLGLDIDCGCFGPEDPEHDAFSGLRTALARDVIMLVFLVFSYLYTNRIRRCNL